MEEKIFKMYDIRGVYPKEINKEIAYLVGKVYVGFFEKENPEIVVGMDGRNSSPELFKNLKKGIVEAGGITVDIGLSSTPMLNFTICKNDYSGGIMVTASHNPPRYNGFKIIKENGIQLYGDDIQKIKNRIKNENFAKGKGSVRKENPLDDYLSHILSFGKDIKEMKVVIDYGNGVASIAGKKVFEKLKIDSVSLFDDVDGDFPNHLPNPAEDKNAKQLITRVKEEKADLGIIFDGDGDRAFFVDEKGQLVYPDLLVALLAEEELLKSKKEKRIYFDLRFSKIVAEIISEKEGVPEMMRVGNPFYKEKLIKEGGLIGAELSGHVMHKDNFYIDDGLFIAVKLIDFLSRKKERFSKLIDPFKKYSQSEEINMGVLNKEKALKKAKEAFPNGLNYDLDGVYIEFDDWWFNLRKSNTEDLVRLRVEADNDKILEEKKKELISLIKD